MQVCDKLLSHCKSPTASENPLFALKVDFMLKVEPNEIACLENGKRMMLDRLKLTTKHIIA